MRIGWALLPSLLAVNAASQGLPPASAPPGGGLGGGLATIDPKAMAFETQLLEQMNQLREKRSLPALTLEARLRLFARKEAEMAARGDPEASKIHDRVKKGGYAPYGYWLQSLYGANVQAVLKALQADAGMNKAMLGEYDQAGVGAFYVPENPPYFQVTVVLAKTPDPMAGKPGLEKAQTDVVMNGALGGIAECYNGALSSDPNLKGDALAKIVIGGEGAVTEVTMLNSLGHTELDACLITLFRGLRFPKPYKGKPVTLNHPMRFTPPHGSKRIGKLSPAQIDGTFAQARGGFFNCYESRLRANPNLAGSVHLSLVVEPDGRTKSVQVTSNETGDEQLSACVLKRAQLLRFPPPKFGGQVEVTYPLQFDKPRK